MTGISRQGSEEITYSYEGRGNRTEVLGTDIDQENFIPGAFSYNSWDEMDGFIPDGDTATIYEYDPEGLRTKKTTLEGSIRYHCDDNGLVVAESDKNDNVIAQNIWGHRPLARKVGGSYYYYVYNGHGDVIQVLDETGTAVNTYEYDEWGNILSCNEQIDNPIRYAGEYYDEETGLYYLRDRYYDPATGRFTQQDDWEYLKYEDPLSLNLYTYCSNNPVNYIDPTGHSWLRAFSDWGANVGNKFNRVNDRYIGGPFNQIASGDYTPIENTSQFLDDAGNAMMMSGDPCLLDNAAGVCGCKEGRLRPPRFILLFFRLGFTPDFRIFACTQIGATSLN